MVLWSSWGSDQASSLKICVWQMLSGCEERGRGEGGVSTEGGCSFAFVMTQIGTIAQNLPLVTSLLYCYWMSNSIWPTYSGNINNINTFFILLEFTVINSFQHPSPQGRCS